MGGGGGHRDSVCEGDETQARVAGPCSQNTRPIISKLILLG